MSDVHCILQSAVSLFEADTSHHTSTVFVQRNGRHAFVQLAGAYDGTARRYLREALEWLFATGTSHVRIEFADPSHDPVADRAVDQPRPGVLVGISGDRDA